MISDNAVSHGERLYFIDVWNVDPKIHHSFRADRVSGCISHPETIAIDFDSGTEDYTPLVRKILAEHPAGEVTIRFGAGTFDFYPEQAAGSYLCVSNNDNGYKRCAFLLEEMRRVRIEGAGEKTQLRFHGAIVPFRVARCEQIVFEAFTIDCDASFIFEGLVVGNDPRTHSITLRPLDPERFEIRSGEPWFTGYDWASPFGENILFDPGTRFALLSGRTVRTRSKKNAAGRMDRRFACPSERLLVSGAASCGKRLYG